MSMPMMASAWRSCRSTANSSNHVLAHFHDVSSASPSWGDRRRRAFAQTSTEGNTTSDSEQQASSTSSGADAGTREAGADGASATSSEDPEKISASNAADASESATEAEAPEERLKRELQEAQEALRKKKHDVLLSLSDFENDRKKFEKELEGRRRRATQSFAQRMVDVYVEFDHLETSGEEELSGSCEALRQGVVMTRDLYKKTLENFGVECFPVELGTPYIAARHEKVGSVTDGNLPESSVAELVQPGWILGANSAAPAVLRKAQVKVAQHGPEAPPPPEQ